MTQQAGSQPGPVTVVPASPAVLFDAGDLVVPATQRLAMPVQRLEPAPLRRLFGEPERLAPVPLSIPTRRDDRR
ncbi:MAG: hypothetical protein WD341_05060 [Tistlia sp.]|uniref:hypothetical protein n=1 Tax=Tistlia sp. TaxID=3057121 RepID=UPI0034A5743D